MTTETLQRYYNSPVNVFARQVAQAFDGNAVPLNRDGEYFEAWANVAVPAHGDTPAYVLNIDRRGYGVKANQVTVSLQPAKLDNDIETRRVGLNKFRASMNSERETQSLIADISRRVVNAPGAVEALRGYESLVAEQQARRVGVAEHARKLAELPNVQLDTSNHPPNAYEAYLYNKSGTYFNARVYTNGNVTFDRIGLVSNEQARKILAILAEGE